MHVYFYTIFVKDSKKYSSHNTISFNWTKYFWGLSHSLKKLSEKSMFIYQWSLTKLSSEENLTIARKTTLFFLLLKIVAFLIYFFL